ncbi:MAG: hypothetical protein WD688_06985 [Candidatus Binatia bacterium]
MSIQICKKLKNFFFPEPGHDNYARSAAPVDGLIGAYELISKLVSQIESHASRAPYPHVAQQLRRIAAEKHDSARKIKSIIENLGEQTTPIASEPAPGKNHWERLNFDLQNQMMLDNLLLRLESNAGEIPQLAEILRELKIGQKSHRRSLSNLLALADPQANQT